jgi:zinc D-Ala-D-Ala carboxypeptidase
MSIQITTKLQFNEHQARYPNFSYEELACQHCGSMDLPLEFLTELQTLREAVDMPLTITSGYRCSEHPIEARKSTPGQHNKGAVDIAAQGSSAVHILKVALDHGWTGIGINVPSFIHLDRREEPTIWKY